MQNIDSLDEGRKKQEKAVKKGKEAELQARKLEVSLNEKRCEKRLTPQTGFLSMRRLTFRAKHWRKREAALKNRCRVVCFRLG